MSAPRLIPIYDATAPIACTLSHRDLTARLEQMVHLRENLMRVERTEHGMVLTFPNRPAIDRDVRQFAVNEKACCQFWGFAVDAVDDELVLRWDAPPAADSFVERLAHWFDGDEPMMAAAGLI